MRGEHLDSKVPTVLIVRFSSIGDAVLATSAMERIKLQFPNSRIVLLVKKQYASLFHPHPFLDEVVAFEGFNAGLWRRLYDLKITAILDLHSNTRSLLVKLRFWNIPSISFKKHGFRRWMLVKKWSKKSSDSVVNRYLQATDKLLSHYAIAGNASFEQDGKADVSETNATWPAANGNGFPTAVGNETARWPGLSLGDFSQALSGHTNQQISSLIPKRYGVMHISATYNTKRIPLSVWRHILEHRSENVVITGGKEDIDNAKALVKLAAEVNKLAKYELVNAVGEATLTQTAAIVQGALWYVGGDTGFTHVAAAYGVPHLTVWGNTSPELGFATWLGDKYPMEIRQDLRVEGLKCQPCSKLGYYACPEGHFSCMKLQNLQELESKLQILRDRNK